MILLQLPPVLVVLVSLFNLPITIAYSCAIFAESELPCCPANKQPEYKCLFNPKDPGCDCRPATETMETIPCRWNVYMNAENSDNLFVPCDGFLKACDLNNGVNTHCVIKDSGEVSIYPARGVLRRKPDNHCNLEPVAPFGPLNEYNFYSTFLPCWLWECEQRLKKPQRTIDRNEGQKWCYPPIMHKEEKLQYCPLYITDPSTLIYEPRVNPSEEKLNSEDTNGNYVHYSTLFNSTAVLPCVLPPVCSPNGTVDTTQYMIPFVPDDNNREKFIANDKYCERICDAQQNNGRLKTENNGDDVQCRVIPSCPEQQSNGDYNHFKVPGRCLKWCTDNDSYINNMDNRTSSFNPCNPRPICSQGKKETEPDARYSEGNPYASERCLKRIMCNDTMKIETHFCDILQDNDSKDKGGLIVVYIIIGCCALLAMLVTGAIIIVLLRKRKNEKRPKSEKKTTSTTLSRENPPSFLQSEFCGATPTPKSKDSQSKEGSKESAVSNESVNYPFTPSPIVKGTK